MGCGGRWGCSSVGCRQWAVALTDGGRRMVMILAGLVDEARSDYDEGEDSTIGGQGWGG